MAEISSTALVAGTAVVSTGLTVFASFMPAMSEVLNDTRTTQVQQQVQIGGGAGALATVSIGLVLTYITKSVVPVLVALGISALMYAAYQFAYKRGILHDA